MDSGSIAWMLTCSALVLLMTPGLGPRSTESEEDVGLDTSDHSEAGYQLN